MLRTACVALLLAGCIEADLVPCGALSCPSGQQCVEGARCVTQQSLDACADLAPGDACSADNLAGRCADLAGVRLCEPAVCGDGVIDEPLREACDGAAAFTTQCVDLGFDLGLPECTTGCALDAAPCTRFGWELVVDATVTHAWTDGSILAYATASPDRLEVHGGGRDVSTAMTIDELAGGAGRVFARSGPQLFEITAAGMVDVTPPATLLPGVARITVSPTGALYALYQCSVARFELSWALLVSEPGACVSIHTGLSGRVFVQSDLRTVRELTGAGYVDRFTVGNSISTLRFTETGAYVATPQELAWWTDSADMMNVTPGWFRSIAVAGDAVYAVRVDGSALRAHGGQLDPLSPPGAVITDDGHGHVYAYGGALYRFSGIDFGDLATVPMIPGDQVVAASLADDDQLLVALETQIVTPNKDGSFWGLSYSYINRTIRGFSARRDVEWVAATESATGSRLERAHGTSTPTALSVGADTLRGVWLAPDLTAYATGSDGVDGWLGVLPLDEALAETRIPDCAFHAVHGAGGRVIAAGACRGAASLWELAAGTWTELHREPALAGPLRAVLIAGDEGALHLAGGTWTVDPQIRGRVLSGGASDDVWLSGSFVPVQHWDGRAWSKMTTRALGPIAVAASARRVLLPGAANDHVSLLRDPR